MMPLQQITEAAADTVTVLKSAGPLLTKVFDGSRVEPYGLAKHFSIHENPVSNIQQLSQLLKQLESKGRRCVIRGQFIGDAKAQEVCPPEKPGMYPRVNSLFEEVPHRWCMFDIDRHQSLLFDPASEPEEAVAEFIETCLPPEFHCASYHWQLSSSAGMKPGILKCHLWFWLETPYTGPQLKAWVRHHSLPIDVAPLRRVQVHYTANPVFQNGANDPVVKRSGLTQGKRNAVALVIPEEVLAKVDDPGTVDGDGYDLTDPTQKPGVIGAFCRTYPMHRVINELLPEEFVFAAGSDRRVTWNNSGGGSPEGCFITDDGWYLGNTHDSDPFDGRLANAFDVVRHYKFGHLDQDLDLVTEVFTRPSYRAMIAWAETQEEVKAEVREVTGVARETWVTRIRDADSEATLRHDVLPEIAHQSGLTKSDKDIIIVALQAKMREITGVRITPTIARGMLREAGREGQVTDRNEPPFWAKPFVYVTGDDLFFNVETKDKMSKQGFDVSFNRFMVPFMDENGIVPAASRFSADVWHLDCVSHVAYNPTLGRIYEMSGKQYANTYSDANVPAVPPVLTDSEEAGWQLVLDHVKLLLPDQREADLFLDWIAHNVQFPGRKIRWSPYMYGTSRAGKSIFQQLLEATMGPDNVSLVPAAEVVKSSFTGWSNEAAVVVIEEVLVPDTSARETDNKLKPMITNETIRVERKGESSFKTINVTNYLLFSNFATGLPLTAEDQRYMVLRIAPTPEQVERLKDAGYYLRLVEAIKVCAGALRKKLLERQFCSEFSPNGHAPMTAAKKAVIELCKSDTHNALDDVIADGYHGVTRDVISSSHLAHVVREKTGSQVFTTTLHKMLQGAGFVFFDRIKWDGDMRRIWVRETLVSSFEGDEQVTRKTLREILDASMFDEAFLK
jgi:hypothetical protein